MIPYLEDTFALIVEVNVAAWIVVGITRRITERNNA